MSSTIYQLYPDHNEYTLIIPILYLGKLRLTEIYHICPGWWDQHSNLALPNTRAIMLIPCHAVVKSIKGLIILEICICKDMGTLTIILKGVKEGYRGG